MRQAAGSPAHGTEIAAQSFESTQVRLWPAGASMAQAASDAAARRGAAPHGSRHLATGGGLGISPRLVFVDLGSLVHRLWLTRRESCLYRFPARLAWANTRAVSRSHRPCGGAGREPRFNLS